MNALQIVLIVLSWIFILGAILPSFRITHWSVRNFDFIRVQLIPIKLLILIVSLFVLDQESTLGMVTMATLLIALLYQIKIIFPYLSLFNKKKWPNTKSNTISIISSNVLQENDNCDKLIALVKEHQPDILLTLESNAKWEKALKTIEEYYPSTKKIALENRYGMHFYTKLKVKQLTAHFLISEEFPSIEAHLEDSEGNDFIFWGVHPPPPSPTEEETSKKKDAELMKVAKRVAKCELPTLVIGDFNNVTWSRSSKAFAKASNLTDPRIGYGLCSTFPVNNKLMRFPLDLLFYSDGIEINKLQRMSDIGSDHFPLHSQFTIISEELKNSKSLSEEEKEEAEETIKDGEEEAQEEKAS